MVYSRLRVQRAYCNIARQGELCGNETVRLETCVSPLAAGPVRGRTDDHIVTALAATA